MLTLIHPTAVIHPGAELHPTVEVELCCNWGKSKIVPETKIGAHAIIDGLTEIGARNQISHPVRRWFGTSRFEYEGSATRGENWRQHLFGNTSQLTALLERGKARQLAS